MMEADRAWQLRTAQGLGKPPRDSVLCVEGRLDERGPALSHVLDHLLMSGAVPVAIRFERARGLVTFSIDVVGLDIVVAGAVVTQLRVMPMVRTAAVRRPPAEQLGAVASPATARIGGNRAIQ